MRQFIFACLFSAAVLPATALPAATTTPADEVKAAIKNLADAANYSWVVTDVDSSSAAGGDATPSSTIRHPPEGKIERGGFLTLVTRTDMNIGGVQRTSTSTVVRKGDKFVSQSPNGTWATPEELMARALPAGAPPLPPAQMVAITAKLMAGPVAPGDEIASLAAKVTEFKSADGVITGDLAADYIVAQLLDRLTGSTYATAPFSPKDISGTLKIWLKDGTLAKYEVHFKGTAIAPGGRSTVVDRTVTTEIKDIGVTKVDVPAAAIAKLEGRPTPAPAPTIVPVPPATSAPVRAPPLTTAQTAVLQGKLAIYVPQLAANTGIKLVPIPAGNFTMGSPKNELGYSDEEGPQTQVTLTKDFLVGATEVTQGQYETVMGTNPSHAKTAGKDAPVEQVSWDDAMAFCQKLTMQERAAGRLPEGFAFTLPTEAQWEYACRAGTTGPYAGNLDAMAWYENNSGDKTHPVGMRQPNAWGLYDMHGNALEWCLNCWSDHHPGGAVTDPTGPASGTDHVLRGGSCVVPADTCRSAMRVSFPHDYKDENFGFRLALIAQPLASPAPKPGAAPVANRQPIADPQTDLINPSPIPNHPEKAISYQL